MALQTVPNKMGIQLLSWPSLFNPASFTSNTLDAAGESVTFIGRLFLEGGTGSKVISAAGGGLIYWRSMAVTFANAGTTLRIGIQDVGATGLEDGIFDVYADLVGGTDTIAANTFFATVMEVSSKTLNHGDVYAISFETISRGGTDSIAIGSSTLTGPGLAINQFPYKTVDTGAGPGRTNLAVNGATLQFDDGTLGWFEPFYLPITTLSATSVTYGSGSSPDEYANIFKVPYKCSVRAACFFLGNIASTDTFELVIYSDPLGTPTPIGSPITVNPNLVGSTTSVIAPLWVSFPSQDIDADTYYGFAIRPTTAGTISIGHFDLGSGNQKFKRPTEFGSDIIFAGRTNQTGAFVETQVYHLPAFGLLIDKLDDGVIPATNSRASYHIGI